MPVAWRENVDEHACPDVGRDAQEHLFGDSFKFLILQWNVLSSIDFLPAAKAGGFQSPSLCPTTEVRGRTVRGFRV